MAGQSPALKLNTYKLRKKKIVRLTSEIKKLRKQTAKKPKVPKKKKKKR